MPNSYGRVKVPLDDALNYFLNYYNRVYDKETDSVTSDNFNRSLFLFLGMDESHRNQIKILEGLLEYVNTHMDDIEKSSNTILKEGLFTLLIFIIFVIALMLYST